MKSRFIKFISIFLIITTGFFSLASFNTVPAFAADPCDASLPDPVRIANGCDNNTKDQLPTVIQKILNSIILVTGTIAVIFIIIGGIHFMTSSGDAAKVKKAKDTILYACIGLIICALSFAIVNWAVGIINKSSAASYTTSSTCTNAGYTWKEGKCQ